MKPTIKGVAISAVALAVSQATVTVNAGTDPYFNPLTQSSAVASPNHINELNSPWQAPAGIKQKNLTSMQEIENDAYQTTQRVVDGNRASMWDMLAFDPSGRYVFIPHETGVGAGVSRYDIKNDEAYLLFRGDSTGDRSNLGGGFIENTDFGAFDPARFTPNNTLWLAEEWSGHGRVVEIKDPWATPANEDMATAGIGMKEGVDYEVLNIPRVSHEGINFSREYPNKVIYFIDEDRSGSIYKHVFKNWGDYSKGQTFVLVTKGFKGSAEDEWNGCVSGREPCDGPNVDPDVQASRFGKAKWVPITNKNGKPLDGIIDPNAPVPADCVDNPDEDRCQPTQRPGRTAANQVNGTPFGRPEDMSIGYSKDGNEMLYITTTSEDAVISVENIGPKKAIVRQFVKEGVTPKNVGYQPTTGVLNSPDNLAIDALGNIYVIEDAPNNSDVGGDIWFARDKDQDGVAESLDHFLSIQVDGAEATGMIFNPRRPTQFVVAVQHPDSAAPTDANPAGHFGDAIWKFNVKNVVPPVCKNEKDRGYHHFGRHRIQTCASAHDVNFVRHLRKAGKWQDPLNP